VVQAARGTHGALGTAGLALCALARQDLATAADMAAALRRDFPAALDDPIVTQALAAVRTPPRSPSSRRPLRQPPLRRGACSGPA
jgi:hypothetical protein